MSATHGMLGHWRHSLYVSQGKISTHGMLGHWRHSLYVSHSWDVGSLEAFLVCQPLKGCWVIGGIPCMSATHGMLGHWRHSLYVSQGKISTHGMLRHWRHSLYVSHSWDVGSLEAFLVCEPG